MNTCDYCGKENPASARFCQGCGTDLSPASSPSVTPLPRAMKVFFKIVVVILALYLEVAVLQLGSVILFGPGHGQIVDTRYRQKERVAAFNDYEYHRSPETTARFQEELRLMHKHEDWKMYLAIGLYFAINGVWIYYFFRGSLRHEAALKPTATTP